MSRLIRPYKRRFDFEIGYLVKSPCKNCLRRDDFPGCASDCQVLDQIQSKLAQSIPGTRSCSNLESHALSIESWRRK